MDQGAFGGELATVTRDNLKSSTIGRASNRMCPIKDRRKSWRFAQRPPREHGVLDCRKTTIKRDPVYRLRYLVAASTTLSKPRHAGWETQPIKSLVT